MARLLYHGSTVNVVNPLVEVGRSDLDFGQGFYLTSMRSQAETWAQIQKERKKKENAVLNVYEYDEETALAYYQALRFEAYSVDWLNFIVACRSGNHLWENYDVVEGGIANDSVIDTVEAYMSGLIDANTALGQLAFHKPNVQICIHNQKIIDQCLRYIESVNV